MVIIAREINFDVLIGYIVVFGGLWWWRHVDEVKEAEKRREWLAQQEQLKQEREKQGQLNQAQGKQASQDVV